MSRIYILRHAKAEPGHPDGGRPLAEKGRRHARDLGAFFTGKKEFKPQAAWCSPLLRANQTLEDFSAALGFNLPVRTVERLEPMADPAPLLEELGNAPDVLIVGHNPNLETLTSLLVGGEHNRARIRLKTCTLVCLEYDADADFSRSGPCVLEWLLDPRLL